MRTLKNAPSPLTAFCEISQLSSPHAADHRLVKIQIITSPVRRNAICMNKPPIIFARLPSPFPENYTFLLRRYTSPPYNYLCTRLRLNFTYTLIRCTNNYVRFKYEIYCSPLLLLYFFLFSLLRDIR